MDTEVFGAGTIVEQAKTRAMEDFARAFMACTKNVIAGMMEQGKIASEVRELYGEVELRAFAHRVGYVPAQLRALADLHDYVDEADISEDVDPGYYLTAATEFRMMYNPGDSVPDFIDEPAGSWAKKAAASGWTRAELKERIRARYGSGGARQLAAEIERDPQIVGRAAETGNISGMDMLAAKELNRELRYPNEERRDRAVEKMAPRLQPLVRNAYRALDNARLRIPNATAAPRAEGPIDDGSSSPLVSRSVQYLVKVDTTLGESAIRRALSPIGRIVFISAVGGAPKSSQVLAELTAVTP